MWLLLSSLILVSCIFVFWRKKDVDETQRLYTSDNLKESYDFIVVGSGSAGSVLCSRLAKLNNKKYSVLLLESGKEYHRLDKSTKPTLWYGWLGTELDYHFSTTPQRELNSRRLVINRGKTTGGCSSLNASLWVRGCREDFDRWAAVGNKGWDFESLLPLFKSVENYPQGDPRYRGTGGQISVTRVGKNAADVQRIVRAITNVGIPYTEDYNGESPYGIGFSQECHFEGRRHDVFSRFVEPLIESYPNLKVVSDALVNKVLIHTEGAKKIAKGVEFVSDGKLFKVEAKKEVILCAGAINSPQLLMLSGIGPKEDLEKFSIPVIHENENVGKNYMDHLVLPLLNKLKTPMESGEGGCISALGFFQSEWSKRNSPGHGPDMQLAIAGGEAYESALPYLLTSELVGFSEKGSNREVIFRLVHNLLRPLCGFPPLRRLSRTLVNTGMILNQPKSRGEIRLRSADSRDHPSINPRTCSAPEDAERLIEAFHISRRIWEDELAKERKSTELEPGVKVQTDKEIHEYLKRRSFYAWHPAGTCKMGVGNDSVVDSNLKVIGVEGLRVADASIMPEIVSGNTNWTSIMIGAKAAEIISQSVS